MQTLGQRFLMIYAGILTAAFAATVLCGFAVPRTERLDTLDVQRINVREPDGTLRMVISSHARLPGIIVKGQERAFDRPQAGMLFYNDEGSENGGLIFGGRRNAQGEVVDSGGSLSFDRYNANQIVQLLGVDDHEDRMDGLAVSDSPENAPGHRRIWIGKDEDGTAALALMDGAGRRRLLLEVPAEGTPSLAFLDADGKVVQRLEPAAAH
ncbi:hypothetical protein [Fulvimonas soli]|jgi:hypothetical protein|uniref:Uncharacterized protein n=1 Tax=Fulvimonas soli TaxID=155197 RepID=A0A316IHI6_9GAMM|nr:hypothetical protein [Fulvimonas soli]PWK92987.1 hypothetical protein C7456_101328 [Fulvimonas soli]TNY26433.1 hypothetical protein BV497_09060 [Fulvimonas soli]